MTDCKTILNYKEFFLYKIITIWHKTFYTGIIIIKDSFVTVLHILYKAKRLTLCSADD